MSKQRRSAVSSALGRVISQNHEQRHVKWLHAHKSTQKHRVQPALCSTDAAQQDYLQTRAKIPEYMGRTTSQYPRRVRAIQMSIRIEHIKLSVCPKSLLPR